MPLPTYENSFDGSLNHVNSLLAQEQPLSATILDALGTIPAEMITSGVIGAISSTSGIEIKTDKSAGAEKTILQSRNFVTGTTGWAFDSDGDMEADTGTFRGDISGSTITGAVIQTGSSGDRIELSDTNKFVVYGVGGYFITQINGDGQIRFYENAAGNDDIAGIKGQVGSQQGEIVLTVGMGDGGGPQTYQIRSSDILPSNQQDLGANTSKFGSLYLAGTAHTDQLNITRAITAVQITTDGWEDGYLIIGMNGTAYRVPCIAD